MTRKNLAAALWHVDQLACPVTDPHRLALERLLLEAALDLEARERVERAKSRHALN